MVENPAQIARVKHHVARGNGGVARIAKSPFYVGALCCCWEAGFSSARILVFVLLLGGRVAESMREQRLLKSSLSQPFGCDFVLFVKTDAFHPETQLMRQRSYPWFRERSDSYFLLHSKVSYCVSHDHLEDTMATVLSGQFFTATHLSIDCCQTHCSDRKISAMLRPNIPKFDQVTLTTDRL